MKSEDLDKHLGKRVEVYFNLPNRKRTGPYSGILKKGCFGWYEIGNIKFPEEIAEIYRV